MRHLAAEHCLARTRDAHNFECLTTPTGRKKLFQIGTGEVFGLKRWRIPNRVEIRPNAAQFGFKSD